MSRGSIKYALKKEEKCKISVMENLLQETGKLSAWEDTRSGYARKTEERVLQALW